jgi:hypothetical protein
MTNDLRNAIKNAATDAEVGHAIIDVAKVGALFVCRSDLTVAEADAAAWFAGPGRGAYTKIVTGAIAIAARMLDLSVADVDSRVLAALAA